MKMTLLGFLGLVALVALLLYIAKQITEDLEKDTRSGYPMPNPNSFDGLEPGSNQGEIGPQGMPDFQ